MCQRLNVAAKLNIEWLIQPQLLADALHDFIAGAITGQQAGRIAGINPQQRWRTMLQNVIHFPPAWAVTYSWWRC